MSNSTKVSEIDGGKIVAVDMSLENIYVKGEDNKLYRVKPAGAIFIIEEINEGKKSCSNCLYHPGCSVWFAGGTVNPKNYVNHIIPDPNKFICGRWKTKVPGVTAYPIGICPVFSKGEKVLYKPVCIPTCLCYFSEVTGECLSCPFKDSEVKKNMTKKEVCSI